MLAIGINLILLLDLQLAETKKWAIATITGFVLLGGFVATVILAVTGDGPYDRCSTAATWSTTTRCSSRRCSCWPPTSWC